MRPSPWTELRQRCWRWRGIWFTAPLVAALVMGLRYGNLLQGLELFALDQLFLLRPAELPEHEAGEDAQPPHLARNTPVVVVTLDEPDLQALNQSQLDDATLAQLLENIRQQQPLVVGLDIYRDLPVPPGQEQLAAVLTQMTAAEPRLFGIAKLTEAEDSAAIPPPPLLAEADQATANDLLLDPGGVIRRVPLFINGTEADGSPGPPLFSLSFRLACQYLEKLAQQDCTLSEEETVYAGSVPLWAWQRRTGGYSNPDIGGYPVLINYLGPKRFDRSQIICSRNGNLDLSRSPQATAHQPYPSICLADVLADRIPQGMMADRIVLIGNIAESGKDLFYIPYSSQLLAAPHRLPGVYIHANGISQILAAVLGDRPLIRSWPEGLELLWILTWAMLGATVTWKYRYLDRIDRGQIQGRQWFNPSQWVTLFLAVGLLGLCYGAFLLGWWLPLVPPLLALGGTAIAIDAYLARTATEIRRIFGRYVTEQVVATLLENPEGLKIGGDRRKITILTSDLRGFTATSERLSPEAVVQVLNHYLSTMTDVIESYGGTIDSFAGDGILVLFGAPTAAADDPVRAVACALAMQQAMAEINRTQPNPEDQVTLEMGIGINTGEVVVGNIGSEKHTQYSVIGNQVNLTYRIESFTVGGQVFISEATYGAIADIVEVEQVHQVRAKGIQQPISVYEVVGLGGDYGLSLPTADSHWVAPATPIAVQYLSLEGKQIEGDLYRGQLVQISEQGAWLQLPPDNPPLLLLSNLKLNLLLPQLPELATDDLYAKVMAVRDGGEYRLRFTHRSPAVGQGLGEAIASSIAHVSSNTAKTASSKTSAASSS